MRGNSAIHRGALGWVGVAAVAVDELLEGLAAPFPQLLIEASGRRMAAS